MVGLILDVLKLVTFKWIAWIWKKIAVSPKELEKTKSELKQEIDEIKETLSRIEQNAPPKPIDLVLLHGIYWGRGKVGAEKQPFCGVCVSDNRYVPFSVYADGDYDIVCRKCGTSYNNLTEQQMAEGKKS